MHCQSEFGVAIRWITSSIIPHLFHDNKFDGIFRWFSFILDLGKRRFLHDK